MRRQLVNQLLHSTQSALATRLGPTTAAFTGSATIASKDMACAATRLHPQVVEQSEDAAYSQRLQEMLLAEALSPDRRHRLDTNQQLEVAGNTATRGSRILPTQSEVAERLRSGQGCSTSSSRPPPHRTSKAAQEEEEEPALDWRELVAAARAAQHAVPGEDMLTDTFQRKHSYLRISLTERCNLRCLYCMPEEGVELTPHNKLLSTEEILRLARLFAEAGVSKVRLTGGEPTLRKDLVQLTAGLSRIPGVEAIGITSNGIALGRKLKDLRDNGVRLLNLSLDTLRPDRFQAMTRRKGLERVLHTMHHALDLGFNPVKLNVVVMRGLNDDEVLDFVELTRQHAINVRFIEYMPFDGNVWSDSKMVPYRELMAAVLGRYPELMRCADPRGEVAKNFQIPGFRGSVSFVTSMTSAFCSDCNRLRLMADGNLKVCLFGANEVSLRDAMREGASDDELRVLIAAAVRRKKAAHAGMFELAKMKNRAMIKIGG